MAVVIETTLGDITVDLFIAERPKACLNFLKLCKLKYYNYNLFHTIERDFIAQTGDPTGVGDGGESIFGVVEGLHKRFFQAESLPKIKHNVPGLLSLVSVGKFMVGSQFFFTLGSDLTSLDEVHCVIGEVVEGREILRQLNESIVDEKFRPYQDIRVTHTIVLDDPFSDPRGFQVPSRSPSPTAERLQNGRIGADEDIDDTAGKTVEEIQEMLAERESKARATILEIVGDLPDADIAPPENVLFVCKLNPVTTDDDLEIIFSRFGKIKGCEVIRDKVTGDSLQYAFVEFEEQKSCEAAYFKMDNVLIDDRRIHVDFSQSVSKVQWRGKGRGVIHEDDKDRQLDFNHLRGKRREERRDHRDRGRSPLKTSAGGWNERSEGRKRSPNGRKFEQTRKRSKERSRQHEKRRSNSRDKSSAKRRKSQTKESSYKRENSTIRKFSPVKRKDSFSRRTKDKRQTPYDRENSSQRPSLRSTSGNRSHIRRHSMYQTERRRSPIPDTSSRNGPERRATGNDLRSKKIFSVSSSRNKQEELRHVDNSQTKRDRHDVLSPPIRTSRMDISTSVATSKKKSSNSKKSHEKKKRKPVISSSSSSESESESSTSSTSSSSSSNSDEKIKKSKKSKKSSKPKSKKRSKKKAKRNDSTSSSS